MKCDHPQCGADATHVPRYVILARGFPSHVQRPMKLIRNQPVCFFHYAEIEKLSPTHLLNQSLRMVIRAMAVEKKVEPDFDRLTVEPLRIDSEEFRVFHGMVEENVQA